MSRTRIRQPTQLRGSDDYDDTYPPGPSLEGRVSVEEDFNAVRSQINRLLNGHGPGAWTDDVPLLDGVPAGLDQIVAALLTKENHKTLRHLIHLADGVGGPLDGWPSGSFRTITPAGSPFPGLVIWWTSPAMTTKIIQKDITRVGILPTIIRWSVYDSTGMTVLAAVEDAITYSGVFEISRTRSVL